MLGDAVYPQLLKGQKDLVKVDRDRAARGLE
jgi:hypothetical protein